jgi:hypothetical protein
VDDRPDDTRQRRLHHQVIHSPAGASPGRGCVAAIVWVEPTSRHRFGSLVTSNRFRSLFDVQRENFLSDASNSHNWRIDQLDRMKRTLTDNKEALGVALYRDFGKLLFDGRSGEAIEVSGNAIRAIMVGRWLSQDFQQVPACPCL